ncbi:RNA polymerase I specific transcription initiation factor RRN3 family protein [Babesia bovis T2Bo]|uniref:Uncharacterized protein n=1 Tax=Babesia bovis TaxID=5865 RepID=A7ATM7_BABBO|nr:RNA polymerase I specific transcription initiation factor RRN3 family protein [Babesia bovis T2Bo]EDO06288.1 RNA polymerase I specific transcription initiation factor RRN3 family protein [Babesia bovis T2Bo]|eukprot:XP_001609856.1 hypothetical protein [Babesia bovis T2Bo]
MASYLSQLRRFKVNRANLVENEPAPVVVNNTTIIRKLQDISRSPSQDEGTLKEYIRILCEEMHWQCASESEVNDVTNGLIDMVTTEHSLLGSVVHEIVAKFRRIEGENGKIDIVDKVFDNFLELKKQLRHILINSTLDVPLEGDSLKIVREILRQYPGSIDVDSVTIFTSVHLNPKYRGMRCFFFKEADGRCTDFSYARCADGVPARYHRLHNVFIDVLVELCRLYPRVIGQVIESFENLYPHYNLALEHHVSVSRNLCTLARRVPALLGPLYRLLITKVTIIDAEIKLEDPSEFCEEKIKALRLETMRQLASELKSGSIDISEAKHRIGNPNWYQELYATVRTDEDLDDMTQKLDAVMSVLFSSLTRLLNDNMDTPAVQKPSMPELTEDSSDSDGSDSVSTSGYHSVSSYRNEEVNYPDHGLRSKSVSGVVKSEVGYNVPTVADRIVSELLDVFEDVVLPTQRCKYVQFLYIHVASMKTAWSHLFLQRLLLILYDEEAHSTSRRYASSYIASIVSRADFIQGQVVCSVVYYLFSILAKFEYLLVQCQDSGASSVTSDFTLRSQNRFGESGSIRSHSQMNRFYSLLQDILHIVSYHAGTLGSSPRCVRYLQDKRLSVCTFLDSHLFPVGRMRETVVDNAISATSIVPELRTLHISLVKAREAVFSSDNACAKGYSTKVIEGSFPYDSFALYHSRYFIRNNYRLHGYYELNKDLVAVKQELVDMAPDYVVTKEPTARKCIPVSALRDIKVECTKKVPHGLDLIPDGTSIDVPMKKSDLDSDIPEDRIVDQFMQATPTRPEPWQSPVPRLQNQGFAVVGDLNTSGYTTTEGGFSDTKHDNALCSSQDSGSSIATHIRSRLQRKHRRTQKIDMDPLFDFYGEDVSDISEVDFRSDNLKRLKSCSSAGTEYSTTGPEVPADHTNDDQQLIVIGIDQLDDFELSLSSSILVNAPKRSSKRIFDLLTATAAYKSAIVNSEVTKNIHKRCQDSLK